MLQQHEQVAAGILNGGIEVKAKDEAEAIKKLNKALKNPEGYGFKIYKSKGYYGKYEMVMTFKGRKGGGSYTEFNLEEKADGIFGIGEPYGGYNGID